MNDEPELISPTKRERRMADRAYFAHRIELLIKLKRLRTKRVKVMEAAVEQLPLFSQGVMMKPPKMDQAEAGSVSAR